MLATLLLGVLLVLVPALARAQAQAQAADSLVLVWTAPSDYGAGAVSRYDIRLSHVPLTAANFDSATQVPAPTPGTPGATDRVTVHGLTSGQTYWFALRSVDDSGNWSAISNVVSWDHPVSVLDTSPPATPADVGADAPPSGGVQLHWTPGAEPDLAGYRLWRAIDASASWTSLSSSLIHDVTFVDAHVPADATKLWYAVSAVDFAGNESARSAPVIVVPVAAQVSRPLAWRLTGAYPNPAHVGDVLHLPVNVPASAGDARIEIVDGGNLIVRRFELHPGAASTTRVDWDGTNDRGALCAPGVYRAWLIAGDVRQFVRIARVP